MTWLSQRSARQLRGLGQDRAQIACGCDCSVLVEQNRVRDSRTAYSVEEQAPLALPGGGGASMQIG